MGENTFGRPGSHEYSYTIKIKLRKYNKSFFYFKKIKRFYFIISNKFKKLFLLH